MSKLPLRHFRTPTIRAAVLTEEQVWAALRALADPLSRTSPKAANVLRTATTFPAAIVALREAASALPRPRGRGGFPVGVTDLHRRVNLWLTRLEVPRGCCTA